MHLVGNNSSMQPTPLWSVDDLYFFIICMYKHYLLPLLLVFVMKCNVKMHCSLPHYLNTATKTALSFSAGCLTCAVLASPAHLYTLQLFIHPLLAHHHLCYVDVYCVFLFYFGCIFLFFSLVWHILKHLGIFCLFGLGNTGHQNCGSSHSDTGKDFHV